MRKTWMAAVCMTAAMSGCRQDDAPSPPRASIPPVGTYTMTSDPQPAKPWPPADPAVMNAPPFADQPLVAQPPPEQAAFVGSYERVGRPRLSLFVNRTLSGRIVPTAVQRPMPAGDPQHPETYLAPGEYDELSARRIDYDAIESVLSEWLAANGRVSLVSAKLSEGQARGLEQGRPELLGDLAKNSQVDVLVQVQARVTQQTGQGVAVRLIAEAMNTSDGESLGRAFVDVPPPLDKRGINEYTRFLARKLMSDMTQTWSAPRPETPAKSATPPATQPTP